MADLAAVPGLERNPVDRVGAVPGDVSESGWLSFADRGLTCATNSERGRCISFAEPVRGLDPLGLLRHPAVTVTVADCDGLATALKH